MARKKTPVTKPRTTRSAPPPIPAPPAKPAIGAWTWFTVLALAALIGFTVYLNRRSPTPADTEPTPSSTVTYAFTAEDGLPSSIEIKPAEGETVRVARNADQVWMLELPEKAEADQGMAEAAATSVSTLRILNEVDAPADILGLDSPAYIITINFTGGSEHVLEVGDTTPTNNGYYVRVNKERTVIVSLDGMDGLLNLASFPPYLNTPTPSPIPTETNAPQPTVTPTP